jgi:hypothetical protein
MLPAGAGQNGTWIFGVAKAAIEEGVDQTGGSCIVAPSGEIIAACVARRAGAGALRPGSVQLVPVAAGAGGDQTADEDLVLFGDDSVPITLDRRADPVRKLGGVPLHAWLGVWPGPQNPAQPGSSPSCWAREQPW